MSIKTWQIISIIFSLIAGTLLHFAYEWSGENILVAAFSSINESTWEHLKLVFFPMLFIAVVGYFLFGKDVNNYIKGNAIGIIVAISFITVFFYTYTGIIGDNYSVINILTFVIAVLLGERSAYKIVGASEKCDENVYVIIIGILFICFIIFTYFPPQINYFRDPVTNAYGIQN